MPKSKTRDKVAFTPNEPKAQKIKLESSAWVPRFMVAFFLIGLAWMVLYYLGSSSISWVDTLGPWNVVIGFGFIAGGFVVSTRWR